MQEYWCGRTTKATPGGAELALYGILHSNVGTAHTRSVLDPIHTVRRPDVAASQALHIEVVAVKLRATDSTFEGVADTGNGRILGSVSPVEYWGSLLDEEYRVSQSYLNCAEEIIR